MTLNQCSLCQNFQYFLSSKFIMWFFWLVWLKALFYVTLYWSIFNAYEQNEWKNTKDTVKRAVAVLGSSGAMSEYGNNVLFDGWLHSRDIVLLIMISLLVSAWYQQAWSLHKTNTVGLMSVSVAWGGVTLSTQPRNLFPPEKRGWAKERWIEERKGEGRRG